MAVLRVVWGLGVNCGEGSEYRQVSEQLEPKVGLFRAKALGLNHEEGRQEVHG